MSYTEDELVPLSALTQFSYCERRCALVHIEQIWNENRFTAEGRLMHERVHEQAGESRQGVRIERGVPLRSLRLGLAGVADVVEFHPLPQGGQQPFPVEYKRGKPKPDHSDEIQLCGQAMCLEEMMSVEIPRGAMFYGKTHHRHDVIFSEELRRETEETARQVHALIASGMTPRPDYQKKCKQCSFIDLCLPKTTGKNGAVKRYLAAAMTE